MPDILSVCLQDILHRRESDLREPEQIIGLEGYKAGVADGSCSAGFSAAPDLC